MLDENFFYKVQQNIDSLVENNVDWSIPVTHQQIVEFQNGNWDSLTMFLPRKEWILNKINGRNILCLAGAGGQQGPLLAAAGANVTVFDLSKNMLSKDRLVAESENLSLHIVQGNMCDLSVFSEEFFDIIINPPSLMYVPDVLPVFKECYRVLKTDGMFIMNVPNPINFICEYDEATGNYIACNKLPYKSYEHDNQGDWIEYGHSLEAYLGGLIEAGFIIAGFYESRQEESCESDFTAKAIKMW